MSQTTPYVGRFAPSPTGYLHVGSLVAALASWREARAAGGRWLLRMEDLDPPREMPGAQDAILRTLETYGLHWDGPVERQSRRHAAYAEAVERLLAQGLAYPCHCSRKQLDGQLIYPGTCRHRHLPREGAAIRLHVPPVEYAFVDRVQGRFAQQLAREVGDFIIQRRDGLYAYQLAVVLDDAWQGITDVVRGADLLDSTPRQLYLQALLGLPQPRYLHIPLLLQPDGHKLGKSYRSPPLPAERAPTELLRALRALGQQPPDALEGADVSTLLDWAIRHWQVAAIPRCLSLAEAQLH